VPLWTGKQVWNRTWVSLAILATCSAMLGGSASATSGVRFSVWKTSLPGGQKLPPGALVAAATRFDGKWVAAGEDVPAGATPVLEACAPNGCNPVVWTSTNGTRWTATWGASATGSIPGELLLKGRGTLLLFDDDEATRLWSSSNGVSWQEVTLPASMGALGVSYAAFGHGPYEATLNNKYAGGPNTVYGQSDTVWTSVNGRTWIHDMVPGPPADFESISVTRSGFRLTGVLHHGGNSAVWTSGNGISWSRSK
jgi:hypothetical protein